MTKFIDGPADGQCLMLKRAPVFIRAVINTSGSWDALDQHHDTPTTAETCHAYVLKDKPGSCHMSFRGGRGERRSGFYTIANYLHIPVQPPQSVMQDATEWQRWCEAQPLPRAAMESTLEIS